MDQVPDINLNESLQKDFDEFLKVYDEMISNGKILHTAIKYAGSLEKISGFLGERFREKGEEKYNEIVNRSDELFKKLQNIFVKIGYVNFISLLKSNATIDNGMKEILAKYVWEYMLTKSDKKYFE
jgi:hypothetical protein